MLSQNFIALSQDESPGTSVPAEQTFLFLYIKTDAL
jgi:hypothetical protein